LQSRFAATAYSSFPHRLLRNSTRFICLLKTWQQRIERFPAQPGQGSQQSVLVQCAFEIRHYIVLMVSSILNEGKAFMSGFEDQRGWRQPR
jgi:hypothetical protein